MDLFLAISQGTGAALSAGVRAAVCALVAGLFAAANLGVDFDGTDFSFLESVPWLVAMAVLTLGTLALARSGTAAPPMLLAIAGAAVGALVFGGSLSDEGDAAWPGLIAGAACGLLGFAASHAFFSGAGSRLRARGEDQPASFLVLFADVTAAVLAAAAIAVPPLSFLALGFAAWVLAVRRRRGARKYEGLRILR